MSFKGLNSVITLILAISLISVSGCVILQAGNGPTNQSTGNDNASNNTTISPVPSINVKLEPKIASDTFDKSRYSWFEYRISVSHYLWFQRVQYDQAEYNGKLVNHKNITFDVDDVAMGDTYTIIDLYYDDDGNFLSGTKTSYSIYNQGTKYESTNIVRENYTVADQKKVESMDLTSSVNNNATLTYIGTDAVAIDGKAYQCNKYSCYYDGLCITLWNDPDVPLPVKYGYPSPIGDYSYKLIGWG